MLWGVPYALLIAAGAIPLIIFLHSRKPKGLRVRTTTLFIWERVLKERPLAVRLGWLFRRNLLLILQILAACLLISALADPSLLHFGTASGDLVVVMDFSASMKAKAKSGNRFEAAKKELLSLVDGLSSGQKMMIIGAGAQPRLLAPFTADKGRLRDLARQMAATDGPGRVKEAILFAYAFLQRGSPDLVVVISDGAFEGAETFARQAVHFRFIKVEGGNDNVGIVGFEVRRRVGQSAQYEIMVNVRNYMSRALKVPLTLSLGGKILSRETVDLAANGRRILIFPVAETLVGILTARLEITDDFATDNQAYLAVNESPVVRILYVGPGNPFLSNLFRFLPQVQLTTARSWDEGATSRSEHDVVIVDRLPVPALTRGNFILIDTVAPNLPIRPQGKVKGPRITGFLAKHPLTEGLKLGDLHVESAIRMSAAGDGVVLARSAETPLLFALQNDALRVLLIGFDLMSSDLPLRVAFPVLFHNAIEWFQPQRLDFPAQSVQTDRTR